MAASTFQGSTITIQYVTPDQVRPAQVVWSTAAQSGVLYPLTFAPLEIWTPELITGERELWAGYWNQNAAVPGVAGITIGEEPNVNNVLEWVATVTVVSTSGNSVSQINLGPREWLPSVEGTTLTVAFGDRVRREVERLDAIEAGA